MKIKYSKPVLTGNYDSSYKPEFKFDLDITNGDDALGNGGTILMHIKIFLNSEILKRLIVENKASLGIKVKTAYLNKYFPIMDKSFEIDIAIDVKELKRIDTIKCTAYITALENVELMYTTEMKERYDVGEKYEFHKNEILAESTTDKIDYRASGSPFIQINSIENQEGIGFSIYTENVISVQINEQLNIAFSKLQNPSIATSPKDILNTFVAFNAIQYALLKTIFEGVDKYVETDWFKALSYNFDDPSYEDLESYLRTVSGSNLEQFDIDFLNKTIQRILNHQLSKKIIETWEASNGNTTKKN